MSSGAIMALYSRRSTSGSPSPRKPKRPKAPKSGIRDTWAIKGGDYIEWHGNDSWHLCLRLANGDVRRTRIARQEAIDILRRNGVADPYKKDS